MSVESRIEDAIILQRMGRFEGALTSVVIAIAATARIRRPKGTASDADTFRLFLQEESASIYGPGIQLLGGFPVRDPKYPTTPAQSRPMPWILYEYLRCFLLHEAELPFTIGFVDSDEGDLSMHADHDSGKFLLSSSWLSRLVAVVILAKENRGAFGQYLDKMLMRIITPIHCKLTVDWAGRLRRQLKGVRAEIEISTPVAFDVLFRNRPTGQR